MNGRGVAVVMRERRLGDPAILVADPTNFQTRLGFKASGSDLRRIISTAGPGIRELILDRSAPEDAKDPRRFMSNKCLEPKDPTFATRRVHCSEVQAGSHDHRAIKFHHKNSQL